MIKKRYETPITCKKDKILMNISTNASINTYADSDYYNHYNIKIPMIQIKRIPQTVQAPRRMSDLQNRKYVDGSNENVSYNQPHTLLRGQPEMQCVPMRGSMYPMPIPKLHRTTEKSFPPPCPFILRSARNVDAPMYLAARQTQ